jgi:hypothetical protein
MSHLRVIHMTVAHAVDIVVRVFSSCVFVIPHLMWDPVRFFNRIKLWIPAFLPHRQAGAGMTI